MRFICQNLIYYIFYIVTIPKFFLSFCQKTCKSLKLVSIDTHLSFWHCVKSVRVRSYSGPCFPAFRLNKSIFSCSGQMRENADQNNFEYGHFSRSVSDCKCFILQIFISTCSFLKIYSFIYFQFIKRWQLNYILDTWKWD